MNRTLMNASLNVRTSHHVPVMQYQRNHTVTQTDATFMDTFHLQICLQNGTPFHNIISFRRRRLPMEITMLDASGGMEYQMPFKVIEYNHINYPLVIFFYTMLCLRHIYSLQSDFSNCRNWIHLWKQALPLGELWGGWRLGILFQNEQWLYFLPR